MATDSFDLQGLPKPSRPGMSSRNSRASSTRSSGTGGQDRHDVVSFLPAPSFICSFRGQMVKYLYRKCFESKWLEPTEDDFGLTDSGSSNLGVMLRRPDGVYTADPMFLNVELVRAVERLGVSVAFTMSSDIVQTLLASVTPFQTELSLDPRGFVLPIVNSVKELASGKSTVTKEAYICLCRQEKYVLVWSDSVPGVLAHGTDVETRLLGLVRPMCLL